MLASAYAGAAIRIPGKPQTTHHVVLLYEQQRKRFATPICGLVHDDSGYRQALRFNQYLLQRSL